MCSVTALVDDEGLRILHNRDEQHSRVGGLPPTELGSGPLAVRGPQDPQGGGTWVAIGAGLAAAILNRNPKQVYRPTAPRSRGELIPGLLAATNTLAAARIWMAGRSCAPYAPFTLIAFDSTSCIEWAWEGERLSEREHSMQHPLLWTSSSLGDHLVEGPRRSLFDELVRDRASQQRFHQTRWPERSHLAPDMHREDARTVSMTEVRSDGRSWQLNYFPEGPTGLSEVASRVGHE